MRRNTPQEIPLHLKPYPSLGLDISWSQLNTKEAVAVCPFCDKTKFYVEVETGLWSCRVCGGGQERGGGNIYTFLHALWMQSHLDTGSSDYEELIASRGLLSEEPLIRWGVCKSFITGEWLVPGFNPEGVLCQLYSYVPIERGGKPVLKATAGLDHQLHHCTHRGDDAAKPKIYLCEGPWDGMALWETLYGTELENEYAVVAIPGTMSYKDKWWPIFAEKEVTLLFDSDYPRKNEKTEAMLEPAGYLGAKRTAQLMAMGETPPHTINYLSWGAAGYDPDRADGYDIRDLLVEAGSESTQRVHAATELFGSKVVPIPPDWIVGRDETAQATGGTTIACASCTTFAACEKEWELALKWTKDLRKTLLCMFSSVVSIKTPKDQLWFRIIGPASCGKTTLCEALSVCRQYVKPVSNITGFHSGYKSDKDGEEDNSLIAQCYNKTLVIKDGDTLLQSQNFHRILAEARDIYDKASRPEWRNQIKRNYEGLNMTMLLCGTGSLRSLDTSELGERFLTSQINPVPDDLEQLILERIAKSAVESVSMETDSLDASTQYDPKLLRAMQMTGGYVKWLRENSATILSKVKITPVYVKKCMNFGLFIAYMRARPSTMQSEVAEREMAGRLVSQITRFAMCLTAVLNKEEVDDDVMAIVRAVALDTAAGRALETTKALFRKGVEGDFLKALAVHLNEDKKNENKLLHFMQKIGICEPFQSVQYGVPGPIKWRLTAKMRKLYEEVTK
jgi:hypothetical protein